MDWPITSYILLLLAVLVYLHRDQTAFRTMKDKTIQLNEENQKLTNRITELDHELIALRAIVREQKADVDNVQEHCARLRKGQQRIVDQQNYLKGKVDVGSKKFEITLIDAPAQKAKVPATSPGQMNAYRPLGEMHDVVAKLRKQISEIKPKVEQFSK